MNLFYTIRLKGSYFFPPPPAKKNPQKKKNQNEAKQNKKTRNVLDKIWMENSFNLDFRNYDALFLPFTLLFNMSMVFIYSQQI